MKTLFQDSTGPLVQYGSGLIHISDLNPEVSTRWRMSRWEMVKLGFKTIVAGLRA